MCRLFAYAAPESSTADRELGPDGLANLDALAGVHADGWGWAGLGKVDGPPIVRTSTANAATDPEFRRVLSTPAQAALVHLRWATLGLAVDKRNTHPFYAAGVAFAHIGSLSPIERVAEMMAPETAASLSGDTDSEQYFALIREKLETGANLTDAVANTARALRAAFPDSSLNSMSLDGDELVVVSASGDSRLSDEDMEELRQLSLPPAHREEYYSLHWTRRASGTVLIASTGVADPSWTALAQESVMTVSLRDLTVRMTPLFSQAHEREWAPSLR